MPRPRQTNKKRQNQFSLFSPVSRRKRKSSAEDLVGKFLFSVAVAVMTTLITLAFAGQVRWEWVVIAFLSCLLVLGLYQGQK
jgi:hypothetical protein